MSSINNKALEEKVGQLKKAIEIVGGKEEIVEKWSNNDKIMSYIITKLFEEDKVTFEVSDKEYSINRLLSIKLDYEKYFLKNKSKTIESVIYKIKKYDTSLDSLIRKYKKTRGIEEYNKIFSILEKTYRRDINMIILKEIDSGIVEALLSGEEEKYYGEYLKQKKKALLDGIISKMGIV
ncbi:Uncharacterised protein [uncultured Clostridium sp.]|uniref:hypothetical protein n=1 Tax=uncultured Clostridium sp. TaxID=59620 RepID=UPI00082144BB|nr:hypothetical protein [uncultured Clostridium sp.]SCJ55915.1 Uncharacterised protein [uncultured Clostridium sp.]